MPTGIQGHEERLELANRFRAAIDLPAYNPELRSEQFSDIIDQARLIEELYEGGEGPSLRSAIDEAAYKTPWHAAPASAVLRIAFAEETKGRPRDVIRIELRNGGTSAATVHVLVRSENERIGEWQEIGAGSATRAALTEAIVAMLPVYNATRAAHASAREAMAQAAKG